MSKAGRLANYRAVSFTAGVVASLSGLCAEASECYSVNTTMAQGIKFRFCGGEDHYTSDLAELRKFVERLTVPKATLLTNPEGLAGYLDFQVLDDSSIEMEIMEYSNDDFATVDIPMAARVVEIAMTDTRNLPLRRKLDGLPIQWLT
jgi:hypothetical protein